MVFFNVTLYKMVLTSELAEWMKPPSVTTEQNIPVVLIVLLCKVVFHEIVKCEYSNKSY